MIYMCVHFSDLETIMKNTKKMAPYFFKELCP